jgi:hypothetical protein
MGIKVKVDQARPVIPEGKTPVDMVTEGQDTLNKVRASSNYGSAPGVQAAATTFGSALTALLANNEAKAKARADLETAEANEPVCVRRLNAQRRSLNSAIEVFADGSKDVANSFGAPLAGKETTPEAITPVNLRGMQSKTHDRAGVRWDPVPGAHGYILQHATNQNDPTTFSAEMSVRGAKFWLAGQTRGTTIYFRVLACDDRLPNGRTTYTGWLGVLVT